MVHSQLLLILDDDKDVLTEAEAFLRGQGVNVHSFTDPFAALEDFKHNSKDCFLVISDIKMPHMNGFQFVRKIREVRPEMKVIFSTTFEMDISEFRQMHPSMNAYGVIKKPLSMRKLGILIRNSLGVMSTSIHCEQRAEKLLEWSVMPS